jgi:hypothetical protein
MAQTQTGKVTATAPLSGTTILTFTSAAALNITAESWRRTGTLCRERDWSKQRLLHELRNGLRYRTFNPTGRTIDWHSREVERTLDVEASTVTLVREGRGMSVMRGGRLVLVLDVDCIGIEVLPPDDAEVPSPSADAPTAEVKAKPSVTWAIATTSRLRKEHKIPQGVIKAKLARLLEAEAEKAVKAGQLKRALKANYIENQLTNWGIWPLSSFK